jgi:hypothetical protein
MNINQMTPLIPSGPRRLSSAPPTDVETPSDEAENTDEVSMASLAIGNQDAICRPEQTSIRGLVWSERQHAHSLRRALKDPAAQWVESYNGALKTLSALNPEHYQMPFGVRSYLIALHARAKS